VIVIWEVNLWFPAEFAVLQVNAAKRDKLASAAVIGRRVRLLIEPGLGDNATGKIVAGNGMTKSVGLVPNALAASFPPKQFTMVPELRQ
jgi:hypothetical protein